MTEVIMRKTKIAGHSCLVPVDDQGFELLTKLPDNRDVGCDVIQRRNPRHHRLYWAIIQFVKMHAVNENGDALFEYADTETISTAVKIATGLCRTFLDTKTGRMAFVPKSISWAAMDQIKFNEFFDNACKVIADRWLPDGTTPESVRAELISMVDGPGALGTKL